MAGNKEYDRRPWWKPLYQQPEVVADPLPPEKLEGDSADTDEWDDNDTLARTVS